MDGTVREVIPLRPPFETRRSTRRYIGDSYEGMIAHLADHYEIPESFVRKSVAGKKGYQDAGVDQWTQDDIRRSRHPWGW